MDIKQLRYFTAVYERRNLSHAAQACNVAQSAISYHLANLETTLGVRLFERQPRGMEPTPAGARLYDHAQAILRGIEAAAQDVAQAAGEVIGRIEIGLPFTVIDAIGVDLIREMASRYPKARVVIHEALSSELLEQLGEGKLDLILCYNAPGDQRMAIQRLHNEELCCAGRPEFFGPDPVPIEFNDAVALPQIVLRRGEASRSISTKSRMLQSLHEHAVLEINSVNGVRKAIAAGVGTAIVPLITVRDLVAAGTIVARPIVNPRSTRALYLVHLADRVPTSLMQVLRDTILKLIAQQVADGSWPVVQ